MSSAQAIPFNPTDSDESLSLNSPWQFKLVQRSNQTLLDRFYLPQTQNVDWDVIEVPSNWEMKGFEEPHYNRADESKVGLYRKTVTLPAAWRTRHVFLDLEGVSFGYTLWVNGQRVGRFDQAFLPCQYDLTHYLHWDGDNVIALSVDRDHPQSHLDDNDAWALSGIYRDVTLFSLPTYYIHDLQIQTPIDTVARTAEIHARLELHFFRHGNGRALQPAPVKLAVRARVTEPSGRLIQEEIETVDFNSANVFPVHHLALPIKEAAFWTAETPSLYGLEVTLLVDGVPMQTVHQRVGLRSVTVEQGVLKINGEPVKLRGVCRHEIHPDVGRALRESHWRLDINLMKKANINSVRCSHYPPHPRFLDLCDEAGLYVLDEVPAGFGDDFLNDPSLMGPLLSRAHGTVMRDRNHPSVIIWDIGNENPLVDNLQAAADYVKRLDPTRPRLFPGSNFNGRPYEQAATGENADMELFAPHYPSNREIAAHLADPQADRPILYTEICHALDQGFGDFAAKWDLIEQQDKMAGAFVWLWADQALKRTVNGRAVADSHQNIHALREASALSGDVWLDANTILDSHGQYGTDGIVYGDRRPQTDYYQVRKVYAPVVVEPASVTVVSGPNQVITLTVANRYDFTNLSQIKASWALSYNGKALQRGEVPLYCSPRARQQVHITVDVPEALDQGECLLTLSFMDTGGRCINEQALRLLSPAGPVNWVKQLNRLGTPGGTFQMDETGLLTARDKRGHVLAHGPWVHAGRPATMAERRTYEGLRERIWEPTTFDQCVVLRQRETRHDGQRVINIRARYSQAVAPDLSVTAEMTYVLDSHGWVDLDYTLTPDSNEGALLEFGLVFTMPQCRSVTWIGLGPYPSYPQKQALCQRGLFTLHPKDPFFVGNHMDVDVLLAHTGLGRTLALAAPQSNMVWQFRADQSFLVGQNARVAGLGTKFQAPVTRYTARQLKDTSGHLRLMIINGDPGLDGQIVLQPR